jgi:hypothetical protein
MTKDQLLEALQEEEGVTDLDELAQKILEEVYKQEREAGVGVSDPKTGPRGVKYIP